MERSIAHLLRYAREEDVQLELMVLSDVSSSAIETFSERIERGRIDVEQAIDDGTEMHGDPDKLRRVVINLVGNAIDELEGHAVERPRITLTGGRNLAGTEVWMKIRDNGPGIDAERLGKIFSPFHTSKEGGTGLGLSIVKHLTQSFGGSIDVQSEVGRGTTFTVKLPVA